jgi:hypothetical protein
MFAFLTRPLLVVRSRMRSQAILKAENLVLRQQVLILSAKSPTGVVSMRAKRDCSARRVAVYRTSIKNRLP